MKKAGILSLFLLFCLLACKKDENEIFHRVLEPSLFIDTEPLEQLDDTLFVDLNLDGTNDLSFEFIRTYYCGSSYPNCNQSTKITVAGLHEDILVAYEKKEEQYSKKYVVGDKINRKSDFNSGSTVYADISPSPTNPFAIQHLDFKGENYIGFQWKKHYYGWIKVRCLSDSHAFEIVEYAYCKNPNKAILAGKD